jgi:hypothetical protein
LNPRLKTTRDRQHLIFIKFTDIMTLFIKGLKRI